MVDVTTNPNFVLPTNDDLLAINPVPQAQVPAPTPPIVGQPSISEAVTNSIASVSEQKRAELSAISNQRKAALGGGTSDDYERLAIAAQNRNNLVKNSQYWLDVTTQSPGFLQDTYGPDALTDQANYRGGKGRIEADQNLDRSGAQIVGDSVNSAGQGFAGAAGGILALGAGMVNNRAGAAITDALDYGMNAAQSVQSDELRNARAREAVATDLSESDNKEQYEIDKQSDGTAIASLKRIGRDAYDTIGRNLSDPTLGSDGAAQAVGSLFAAGPVGKGVGLAGKGIEGILKAVGKNVTAKAATVGEAIAMPTAIGLMESGGSYQQASQEVDQMSTADLEKNSPFYNDRIAAGDTPEEAKAATRNRAGQISAALTFGPAALAGKVVSKFEANPLALPSVKGFAGNTVKEVLEEGIQGVTGQASINQGKAVADKNQDPLQGIGTNLGQSVLYAATSTAGVQAPGLVLNSALRAAKAGVNTVADIGSKVQDENKKASPVAPAKIVAATNAAVTALPEITQALATVAAPQADTPEKQLQVSDYISRINNTAQISPEEIGALPSLVQEQLPEGSNRIEAMIASAFTAADETVPENDRISAGLFVLKQLDDNQSVFDQDLPAALENLDPQSAEYQAVSQYAQAIDLLNSHPDVVQTLKVMREVERMQATPVTQNTASDLVAMSGVNAAAINPETAAVVLKQSDDGDNVLSPEAYKAIQASSFLAQTNDQHKQEAAEFNLNKVSNDIQYNEKGGGSKLSMNQHVSGIIKSYTTGDIAGAQEKLGDFMRFAEHMGNKVAAGNEAFKTRQPVKYKTLDAATGQWKPESQWGKFVPQFQTAGGIKFAQRVYADAKAVILVANNMAETMSDLGHKPVRLISLAQSLRIPSEQIQNIEAARTAAINEDKAPVVEKPKVEVVEPVKAEATPEPVVVEPTKVVEEVKDEVVEPAPVKTEAVETPTAEVVEESTSDVQPEKSEQVDEESEPTTVAQAFPELIKVKGKNYFHEAFNLPKQLISRLFGEANPLDALDGALSSKSALASFMGADPKYQYTPALARSYGEYLELSKGINRSMQARLKAILEKTTVRKEDGAKVTLGERAQAGEEVTRWRNTRLLNLLQKTKSGSNYNPQLIQQAIAASLHWVLNAEERNYPLEREEIAKITKLPIDKVTDELERDFNRGLSVSDAKRGLADLIQQFWGVTPNANTPDGYTKGIAEAAAAELLIGLQDVGLVKLDTFTIAPTIAGEQAVRTHGRVYMDVRPKDLQELVDNLSVAPSVIADAALAVNPNEAFIGTPPAKPAEFQMRNNLVKNTAQQKAAIERANNIPYFVNTLMTDFMQSIGQEALVNFLGGQFDPKKKYNKNHRKTVEGKALGLNNAFKNAMLRYSQIENYANGSPINEVPQYFDHNISRVGRLHMLGIGNPQADKVAREVFMSTVSRLNMNNQEDADKFWMTVAQALGVKTERKYRADAIAEAKSKVEGKYAPAITLLQDYLTKGTKLGDVEMQQIASVLGSDATMKALHGLLVVAKLNTSDNLTEFDHSLSLEADGKTDGPINALVHFTAGMFTSDWVRNVAKGGLFLGSKDRTLNDHYNDSDDYFDKDADDLYQATTTNLSEIMSNFRSELAIKSPEAAKIADALYTVMTALNGKEVKFDKGQLTFERGVAKNPLTITVYGSGVEGIAGKIMGQMVDTIYEKMSQQLDGDTRPLGEILGVDAAQFSAALNTVISSTATLNSKNEYSIFKKGGASGSIDAENFTFNSDQLDNFKTNVKQLFADKLDGAIKKTMGPSMMTTQKVQKSIQYQSIVLKDLFQQEVNKRLDIKAKLDPDFQRGEFLSQNELKEVYKVLSQYAPVIDTGTQTFFVGGKESSDLSGSKGFSSTFDDKLNSAAYVFGPTNAGVSGSPYIVIGTGDGQMVQNIMTGEVMDGILAVFDGIEMPAGQIDNYSKLINKAVYDGWMNNPVAAVSKSFNKFMGRNPFANLSENGLSELKEAVFGRDAASETDDTMFSDIAAMNEGLALDAQSIQARKRTLARVQLSVDHMASAESPHSNVGEVLPVDPSALLSRINEIYNEELAKLAPIEINSGRDAEPTVIEPKVEKPSKEFVDAVASLGSIDGDTGARVLSTADLDSLRELVDLSPEHAELMEHTLATLKGQGWKAVVGPAEALAAYERINESENATIGDSYYGKAHFGSKTLYINAVRPETLVHELIHAATYGKVAAYVANPKSVSQTDGEAIARIKGLMEEWLTAAHLDEDPSTRERNRAAYSEVARRLNANEEAAAINEFMAWSLANQEMMLDQRATEVKNPKYRVIGKVLTALKNLIWGKNVAPAVGKDLYSNLKFNTRILLAGESLSDNSQTALYQSATFGKDQRLTDIRERFFNSVSEWIDGKKLPTEKAVADANARAGMAQAINIADVFMARGFSMNMQQASTFRMITGALATQVKLDPTSLGRIQELYSDVMKNLKVEDFMHDPQSNDPNDRFLAQEKYNVLNGVYVEKTDTYGRSSLMPSFLALAMVDDGFRKILSEMKIAFSDKSQADALIDRKAEDLGNAMMDTTAAYISGQGLKSKTVVEALDALNAALTEQVADQSTFIENESNRREQQIAAGLQDYTGKAGAKLSEIAQNTNNKFVRTTAELGRLVLGIINTDIAEGVQEGVTSALNRVDGLHFIREFMSEIYGRTRDNKAIFDMISLVRTSVQQTRQQFREQLPAKFAQHFTRELSETEWSQLHLGLGKTDVASLLGSKSLEQINELLRSSSKVDSEINKMEIALAKSEPLNSKVILRKAQELSQFMLTGKVPTNLLRNGYAIASMLGEGGRRSAATEQTVNDIDHLVTLYALKGLPSEVKATLTDLSKSERDGLSFAVSYLVGQRNEEINRLTTPAAQYNYYKGHIPSENQAGISMIVASDTEYDKLIPRGYQRVADYKGSDAEGNADPKGYYFSPVASRAGFNQGIIQTVRHTAGGIDPVTGLTVHGMTAGSITDPDQLKRIAKRMRYNTNVEALMPVYGQGGIITAYERSIDPSEMARLNPNTHLGEMIGAWRGRQVEEAMATKFNEELINHLGEMWNSQRDRAEEYIDMANLPKDADPVYKDAWNLVGKETREYIKEVFGDDGFRVRKDLMIDATGYRSASVGDFWTGTTRWKPAVQERFQQLAMGIFGNDAYKRLVQTEGVIQKVVSEAKVLVVVKSVVVPFGNMMSNMHQMLMRGIPLRTVLRGVPAKTVEINQYIKGKARSIELEADLRAATAVNDISKIREIKTELTGIEDANKRSSLKALIDAGEFSSISDAGAITQEDLALADGRFGDYMEQLANKLPGPLQTAGRYALITKDTALFKGLAKAVQYGDFIAKAIIYDDLIERKGMTTEEAIGKVSEEFVNYNRLSGRDRTYLESMGLLWFWNFKVRSVKVALSMIRENPVRALFAGLTGGIPMIGDLGSPLTDNFVGVLADGKLGYSVGPGQGLNSFSLNPWWNLTK